MHLVPQGYPDAIWFSPKTSNKNKCPRGQKRRQTLSTPVVQTRSSASTSPGSRLPTYHQRVKIGIWYILGPYRDYHIVTLGPRYLLQRYLDLLGTQNVPMTCSSWEVYLAVVQPDLESGCIFCGPNVPRSAIDSYCRNNTARKRLKRICLAVACTPF